MYNIKDNVVVPAMTPTMGHGTKMGDSDEITPTFHQIAEIYCRSYYFWRCSEKSNEILSTYLTIFL